MLLIFTVVIVTLLLSSTLSRWLSEVTDLEIPSIGTVKTIGIEAYWDENLENKTEEINSLIVIREFFLLIEDTIEIIL